MNFPRLSVQVITVAATLGLWAGAAQSQSGSTGGSIGKQGKSVSGGEEPQPRQRTAPKPRPAARVDTAPAREAKPAVASNVCRQLTGHTWSSWASGMFGAGDTTFSAGGRAVHRSGITGTWSCSGSKILLQWPGEGMRPMTMSADGKTLLGEEGQTRFSRN
jgi:hypothetical protein